MQLKTKFKIGQVGIKNNRLTTTGKFVRCKNKSIKIECVCQCGTVKYIGKREFVTGRIKSCGCLQRESVCKTIFENTLSPKQLAIKHKFNSYKCNAKKRKLMWELMEEDFVKLLFRRCFYCNSLPSGSREFVNRRGKYTLVCNGVDRVNNSKGYELTNCRSCCRMCNVMKNKFLYSDFIKQCAKIVEHRKKFDLLENRLWSEDL